MAKIKGSTLIETLIALIILVIISTILFIGVIRIESSLKNDLRTYAFSILTSTLNNQYENFEDSRVVIDYESFFLIKETKMISNDLLSVKVEVISKEEKVIYTGSCMHVSGGKTNE